MVCRTEPAYPDSPRFSLSEKKMIIRHSFRTNTSASSSSAYKHVSVN
jgi:hypothetical protein